MRTGPVRHLGSNMAPKRTRAQRRSGQLTQAEIENILRFEDAKEDEAMRLAQESFPGQDIKDLYWIADGPSEKLMEVTCVVSGELKTLYPAFPIGHSEEDKFCRLLELYNRMNILFIEKCKYLEG